MIELSDDPLSVEEVAERWRLPQYGVRVLLEAALAIDSFTRRRIVTVLRRWLNSSDDVIECVSKAGLIVEERHDQVGICHTLLVCSHP